MANGALGQAVPPPQQPQQPMSPATQAAGVATRAASMEQEDETGDLMTRSLEELDAERKRLTQASIKMAESLQRRRMPFDPALMAAAAGFLKPTKTGGFGESLGYAMEGYTTAADEEMKRELEIQKRIEEANQRSLAMKQKQVGSAYLRNLMGGQAPSGGPMQGMGAPAGGAGSIQEAIVGMRPVTLKDIAIAREIGDPDLVKFLETSLNKQQEQQKIALQERGLESMIPGTSITTKGLSQNEINQIRNMWQQTGGGEKYFKFLYENFGIGRKEEQIPDEEGAPKPGAKFLPPAGTAETKEAESRAGERGKSIEEEINKIRERGDAAPGVISQTKEIYNIASAPEYQAGFGILAKPGIGNAVLTFLSQSGGSTKGLEEAVRRAGLKNQDQINAVLKVAQPLAQLELQYTQLYLKGQGQITEGEREIVRRTIPQIGDPAKVVMAKAETIRVAAEAEKLIADQFDKFLERRPNATFRDFKRTAMYNKIEEGRKQQLDMVLGKYFPKATPKQGGSRTPGPLEQSIFGGEKS